MATTIAVLGGTGLTGRNVVEQLVQKPDVNLRVYARSRPKLLALFPGLEKNPRVSIFVAPVNDVETMKKCLSGVDVIIFTLGLNDNLRGVSVIEDGAKSVVAALQDLKGSTPDWRKPRLLLLSSSTWNERFASHRPAIVHWLISNAFYYPYLDLRQGTALLQSHPDLVDVTLIQPGALVEDEPSGHEINTESVRLAVSYPDLAAGFVELATVPGYEKLKAVGVSSKKGDQPAKYGPELARRVLKGFCAYIPGFWTVHSLVAGKSA
ncbi:Oxidoreductase stcQ [Exophiala dermatitidis]